MAPLFDHLPGEVVKLSIFGTGSLGICNFSFHSGRLVGMTLAVRIQTVPYRQGCTIKRFNNDPMRCN